MTVKPPKWPDRFLEWYCNPSLLEEIQGDAYELYMEQYNRDGKRRADLNYAWNVIRFFRWSNIKRSNDQWQQSRTPWNLNFKIAVRNANRNKFIYATKTIGLAISISFALLILAYVLNEYTYDQFHVNHDRLYRVTSKVNFTDRITHYAVTPLPIGKELTDHIPEIENYFRFMYEEKSIYRIDKAVYHDEITLAVDSAFLRILTFKFIAGDQSALDEPNSIVLTQSHAQKFFGAEPALGKMITFGQDALLTVTGVIEDVPPNSHLQFDVLISWDTFQRNDDWGNLNAYNYVLLRPDATINQVKAKTPVVLKNFHDLVAREYDATFEPIFEKITSIHFSESLDEDIAVKKSKSNLLVLSIVVVLFLVTGLVNYLNLSLAELTVNMKRIGVLRIFGGITHGYSKLVLTETLFTLLLVIVLTFVFCIAGLNAAGNHFGLQINPTVFQTPLFIIVASGFLVSITLSAQVNAYFMSKVNHLIDLLKGKTVSKGTGISFRKFSVSLQLAFSIILIALVFVVMDQFNYMKNTNKGFNDRNLLVVKLRAEDPSLTSVFLDRLRAMSGVTAADGSSYFPGIIETKYVFQVETDKGMQETLIPMINCGYEYLEALDVTFASGRGFSKDHPEDLYGGFIVNEAAAKTFGWTDAIGKKIIGPVGGQGEFDREGAVIGVAKDFNFATLHSKIEPLVIFLTNRSWGSPFIYIKTDPMRSAQLLPAVKKEFTALWPELPFEWEYLDSKYASLYKKDHDVKDIFQASLIISILISCLSIFSMSALLTTLRYKELGIRKVVGASPVQLFLLQSRAFAEFLIISVLLSVPVIWWLSDQWLMTFAYHITMSAAYFIIPAVLALTIIIAISAYHFIKGALVNPADIIKYE